MKLLITGGFGYVGGRLGQYLVSQGGHDVVLGSRFQQQTPAWLPQARTVEMPWNSPAALDEACAGVDAIVHAAGMNAQDCYADPVVALEFNGGATGCLLQAAIRQGVKRFIYISTAHVYASPLEGRINEQTCPASLHPYATSHRAGEDLVRHAHQRGQIEGVVVRLSNAFGTPTHKEVNCWMLLVNDLCRQAVRTRKLVLRSSGLQQRDFITQEDVSRSIKHLLELELGQCGDGLFNLGGAWAPRVIDMVELIQARCSTVLGFKPEIIRPVPGDGEVTLDLDFRIDRLLASGFKLAGDPSVEIDATLLFCRDSFESVR